MSRYTLLTVLIFFAVFAASPAMLVKVVYYTSNIFVGVQETFLGFIQHAEVVEKKPLYFVGDVMLARHVETLMDTHGSDYPYSRLTPDHNGIWVGNFEATVPNDHEQTEDFTFAFSVDKMHLEALHNFGFGYLSLANNHSLDFGLRVFSETKTNLHTFEVFGNPQNVDQESVAYVKSGDEVFAIIGLHDTAGEMEVEAIAPLIEEVSLQSDFQIVYIHWGDEYELQHNGHQQSLAQEMIDSGVDAVIGHHAHVVQDIELYQGKPIFYSLGNFIFDQYFDESVQEGLVVKITASDAELLYELMPVSTIGKTAAPQYMEGEQKSEFLALLADRSAENVKDMVISGAVVVTK